MDIGFAFLTKTSFSHIITDNVLLNCWDLLLIPLRPYGWSNDLRNGWNFYNMRRETNFSSQSRPNLFF